MLTIQLFGEFQCHFAGQPVRALYAPRLRTLLAYLVLHRTAPIARQQLALHFWPTSGETQRRTNLRNLLTQLRTALPQVDHYLSSDLQSIQWRAAAEYTLDVAEFQQALAAARQATELPIARQQLEAGLQRYTADLLPSCDDEWLHPLRTALRNSYLQGLEDLADLLIRQGDYSAALGQAQQLLHLDPLRESSYARLMKLHAMQGDRANALRIYHTCVTTLIRELGVEPSTTTRRLYEQLLNLEREELPTAQLPATTVLVGRAQAWTQLQAAWQRARRGAPLLLLIQGETGVGKTRLAEALIEWAATQGDITITARCYSITGQLALAPILDWLRAPYFQPAIAALNGAQLADLARLLPEVATTPPMAPIGSGNDAWQRQRLFALMARLIHWQAEPRLLFIDDLQWGDRETFDWLYYLLRFQTQAPLFVIATVRTEEVTTTHPLTQLLPQLRRTDEVVEVMIPPLDPAETAQLATTLLGRTIAHHEATALFTQTAGNPLFIVETLRAQAHSQGAIHFSLSPKVQAVIQSRLLRLSAVARELVDVAAVIGHSFTLALLAQASEQGEDALTLGLDELWQNKIVQTQDADAYDFSHDQVREVALAGISPAWRRRLHQRVAQALAAVYAHQRDRISGQLAYHYEASHQFAEAIHAYQHAARVAHRLTALDVAIGYLQQARQLVVRVPEPAMASQLELALAVALAPLLQARRGYSAPEVEATLRRALELCRLGESPHLFRVLWGLGRFYLVLPNFRAGLAIGAEMVTVAGADPDRLLEAHNTLGAVNFHLGDLATARNQLEQAITLYDPARHQEHALIYGQDPGIISLIRLVWTLWCLGETTQAHTRCTEALQLIERCSHPFSRCFGFTYAAFFYQFCGDVANTLHYAELAKPLADEHGFPIFQGMVDQIWGWAMMQQGQAAAGLAQQLRGMQIFTATGTELGLGFFATLHAESYLRLGQIEQALACLAQGLAVTAKTHERWIEPQLYRQQSDLLRRRNAAGDQAAADAARAKAVASAEEIGALAWLA